MPRPRRWLAVVCVFVIVAGALLAPLTGGSPPAGILVPLAPLFGLVLLLVVRLDDAPLSYSFTGSPRLPSRAPPPQL